MFGLKSSLLAALALAAGAAQAGAVVLTSDGGWNVFDVDSFTAISAGVEWIDITNGSALSFNFTVPIGYTARLTVVDAGFAGDTFKVFNGTGLLGSTGAVAVGDIASADNAGLDFDLALANPRFSSAVFMLSAGSHQIRGLLSQSVQDFGSNLNATVGGLRVSVVPEPATIFTVLAGLGMVGVATRRRRA